MPEQIETKVSVGFNKLADSIQQLKERAEVKKELEKAQPAQQEKSAVDNMIPLLDSLHDYLTTAPEVCFVKQLQALVLQGNRVVAENQQLRKRLDDLIQLQIRDKIDKYKLARK